MRVTSKTMTGLALALCLAGCGKPKSDDNRVFGVARGQQISTLQGVRPLNEPPLINYSFTPAQKDPAFSDYAMLAGPTVGVCVVRAKGSGMTQDALNTLRDKLKGQYGDPGFSAETNSYFWPANVGDVIAGTNIGTVVLNYFGSDVSLTYTFTNVGACNHELAVQPTPGDGE